VPFLASAILGRLRASCAIPNRKECTELDGDKIGAGSEIGAQVLPARKRRGRGEELIGLP